MNFDRCPKCHTVLRTGRGKNTRLILVDTATDTGVSFFVCPDCHAAFNPWHPNREPERWKTTEPHVKRYTPCKNADYEKREENDC